MYVIECKDRKKMSCSLKRGPSILLSVVVGTLDLCVCVCAVAVIFDNVVIGMHDPNLFLTFTSDSTSWIHPPYLIFLILFCSVLSLDDDCTCDR